MEFDVDFVQEKDIRKYIQYVIPTKYLSFVAATAYQFFHAQREISP